RNVPVPYRTLSCKKVSASDRTDPIRIEAGKTDQTITLKLCDAKSKNACDVLTSPVIADTDFFVSASADSGQLVRQTIISGDVTPFGGNGTVHYRANSPGTIII